MDRIAESTHTTRYLEFLESMNLRQWHLTEKRPWSNDSEAGL